MTIQLPKELRGFTYRRVMPADFNTFDTDAFLPSLYFKVISGGHGRARLPNDPQAIDLYLNRLLAQDDLVLREATPSTTKLVDRLIRTTAATVGKAGEGGKKGDKIQTIDDSTILSFQPGLPFENTAIRRVDDFVYSMLRRQFSADQMRDLFVDSLGRGVSFSGSPDIVGTYDQTTDVDTLTRLTLLYLDGFESTGIRELKAQRFDDVLPGVANGIAKDLARFLRTFASVMSARALTYHFKALISFSLFTYTVKLIHALPALCENPSRLPPAMSEEHSQPSQPSIYVDFTEQVGHRSREMAVAGMQRELGQVSPFITSVFLIRQLDAYIVDLDGKSVERFLEHTVGPQLNGPQSVAAMLKLHRESEHRADIEALARGTRRDITRYTGETKRAVGDPVDTINDEAEIEAVTYGVESALDQVVRLLVDAQQTSVNRQVTTWLGSVGGVRKPYGILKGVVGGRGRLGWRYQPSNDLLATLVMMAGVDIPEWDPADPRPQPIRLRDFLDWLERRFSILVDRPPDTFSGAEYQAAAQDNLRAMLGRLRQMGIFRDLSDDFTVQRLIPPYTDAVPVSEQRPQEQTR